MYTKGNIYSISGVSWDVTNSYLGYRKRRKDNGKSKEGSVEKRGFY